MKHDFKNIFYGILSFLVLFGIFKLAGITTNNVMDAGQGVIIVLLLFIYFEILDLPKKK